MKYEKIQLRQDHYISDEIVLLKAQAPKVGVEWVFKGVIGTYCPGPGKYDLNPCIPEGVGVLWGPNYPLNWWVVRIKDVDNEGHFFNSSCEKLVYSSLLGKMVAQIYYYYDSFNIVIEKRILRKNIILTPEYDTLGFVLACNASYAFKHFVHPEKGGKYDEKVLCGVKIEPRIERIEDIIKKINNQRKEVRK
ncbi:MAG: hypothetical protein QXV73_04400 [Candidatus Micrarchaeia archaeon]